MLTRALSWSILPGNTEKVSIMSASMKLLYAPASPFVRKVRAAAIELGLNDRIELEPVR